MIASPIDRALQSITCPLCHEPGPLLSDQESDHRWHCRRCDHPWTATRVATAAAYTDWAAARLLAQGAAVA